MLENKTSRRGARRYNERARHRLFFIGHRSRAGLDTRPENKKIHKKVSDTNTKNKHMEVNYNRGSVRKMLSAKNAMIDIYNVLYDLARVSVTILTQARFPISLFARSLDIVKG
jgi:hypothetical protein